jgi:pyridoxal phosphate enzyme (YggS family)
MTDDELRTVLGDRIAAVRSRIAEACHRAGRDMGAVTLVGVTKTVSPRVAAIAFELGLHELGESKPQELWKKAAAMPAAKWHFVGHLQRNKIDRTVPLVRLVHSADSLRLLEALDAFGRKQNMPVAVLAEVNCGREASKGGFAPEELPALFEKLASLPGISVQGLMTMAPFFYDPRQCRPVFTELRELRDRLSASTGLPLPHLSMGMSNDFEVAIEEGATLVRIGTTLFENLAEGEP